MTEPDLTAAVRSLTVGTRASELATTQTRWVAEQLPRDRWQPELVTISTEGDRSSAPLTTLGGTGVFVSALREALVAGTVEVVVHSMKDLPTGSTDELGIRLAAVPRREDPRDALVARDGATLGELAPGSRVGTGSPRRAAQLRALGLGLEVVDIRGNVDTRLGKVRDGELDAVILARAGLARLGRTDLITEVIDPLQMLPAPSQGALAVECRTDVDPELAAALAAIDDPATRAAATAERALLATLEAGCSAPVGALAEVVEGDEGEELWLRATVLAHDGTLVIRDSATGPVGDAAGVGTRLAERMLDDGAAEIMQQPA